jgi:hypothetical protein
MIEVHPPHHSPNTWRDFLLHIATIVVGLLIAIGLEQTVEMLHRRHEMQEAREHIRAEADVNERVERADREQTDLLLARMNRNLASLRAVGTKQADPAATLDFTWTLQNFFDAAYSGAKESGALHLMPYEESAAYEDAYTGVAFHVEAMADVMKQIYASKALLGGRRLGDLSPAEVTVLESSIVGVIGKAEYFNIVNGIELETWQSPAYPDPADSCSSQPWSGSHPGQPRPYTYRYPAASPKDPPSWQGIIGMTSTGRGSRGSVQVQRRTWPGG